MKPEDFIRKYGIKKAKEVIEDAPEDATDIFGAIYMKFTERHFWSWHGGKHKGNPEKYFYYKQRSTNLSELKRLVESLDFIRELGGIKPSRECLVDMDNFNWHEFGDGMSIQFCRAKDRLALAISDHELIYGVPK